MGGPGGRGGGGRFGGPAAGSQRYNLTFSANIRNLFNIANLGVPGGDVGSPNFTGGPVRSNVRTSLNPDGPFDESNSASGGIYGSNSSDRRIDLQMVFTF